MRVILASKSPRRRELLSKLFCEFEIITRETDESLPRGVHPREGVAVLARRKGAAVKEEIGDGALIISSDTLVELDGIALGKPKDSADAIRMLTELSGRTHNVHTGVAVHYGGRVLFDTATTAVTFRRMTKEEIESYVATGEPMDKAGSYGIQGMGGNFVSGYEGDYDTVVGLSLKLTEELINRITKDD